MGRCGSFRPMIYIRCSLSLVWENIPLRNMGIKRIEDAEEKGDVHLCEPWRHEQYNDWKFNIKETDQDDSEVIKDMSWRETHRKWDEDYYCWTVDLDSFFTVLNHLADEGYSVTFDEDVLRAYGRNMASEDDEDDI